MAVVSNVVTFSEYDGGGGSGTTTPSLDGKHVLRLATTDDSGNVTGTASFPMEDLVTKSDYSLLTASKKSMYESSTTGYMYTLRFGSHVISFGSVKIQGGFNAVYGADLPGKCLYGINPTGSSVYYPSVTILGQDAYSNSGQNDYGTNANGMTAEIDTETSYGTTTSKPSRLVLKTGEPSGSDTTMHTYYYLKIGQAS